VQFLYGFSGFTFALVERIERKGREGKEGSFAGFRGNHVEASAAVRTCLNQMWPAKGTKRGASEGDKLATIGGYPELGLLA
jgi:hypothetical protein